MLTVRDKEEEKVEALELGADDYVTKPFSMRELIARVRSAIRRVKSPVRAEDAPSRLAKSGLTPSSGCLAPRPADSPDAQGIRYSPLSDDSRRPRGDLCRC